MKKNILFLVIFVMASIISISSHSFADDITLTTLMPPTLGLGDAIRIINDSTNYPTITIGTSWTTLKPPVGPFLITVPSNTTVLVTFVATISRTGIQTNYLRLTLDDTPLPGDVVNWGGFLGNTYHSISISRIIVTPNTGSNHTIAVQSRNDANISTIGANEGILNALVYYKANWPSGTTN